LILDILHGHNNSYLESPVPSGTGEKMDCFDDEVVVDLMNTEAFEEDSRFFVKDGVEDAAKAVAEDVTNSEADLDLQDEVVIDLIHGFFGNINNALN
ncbi:hypothetical protein KI387_034761, partial [Taxus chinensis]